MNTKYRLFGYFFNEKPKNIDKIAIGLAVILDKIPYVIFVANNKYNALYSPGGTKEDGESDFETLKRELKEELGVDLLCISKEYISTYVYSPKKNTYIEVRSYVGKIDEGVKITNPNEIESIFIFPYSQITSDLLRWLNQKYLLGPSVIDVFLNKRRELDKILSTSLCHH